MRFYMSGTPTNDQYQLLENRLCTHRLVSLHGPYRRAVMRWLSTVVEHSYEPHPKTVLLDSGAFSAWNAGKEAHLEEVIDAYAEFIDAAGDTFEEIWMINLDKIPGEAGRDPTEKEIADALVESDKNYRILTARFGERILPVFHQGEDFARLEECADMTRGRSNYICVSPRNDLAESRRHPWALDVHRHLELYAPECRTHGLATTGNKMIRNVPWFSIDSAAWIQRAGYGMVIVFHADRYRSYFLTYDSDKHRTNTDHIDAATFSPQVRREIIAIINRYGFTLPEASAPPEVQALLAERGIDVEQAPHPEVMHSLLTGYINRDVEPFVGMKTARRWDNRIRAIISLGELDRYGQWATNRRREKQLKITGQQVLL